MYFVPREWAGSTIVLELLLVRLSPSSLSTIITLTGVSLTTRRAGGGSGGGSSDFEASTGGSMMVKLPALPAATVIGSELVHIPGAGRCCTVTVAGDVPGFVTAISVG